MILAIADGAEISRLSFGKRQSGGGRSVEERNIRHLYQELEELRDSYTKVLVHQLLIFDYLPPKGEPIPMPEGIFAIPPVKDSKRTTMKTVMCDVSSMLLAEMNTLAKSFEAKSFVDSPGQPSAVSQTNGSSWGGEESGSLSDETRSIPSPQRAPAPLRALGDRSQHRLSMPVPSSGAPLGSSSSDPSSTVHPREERAVKPPPTTFEDIAASANSDPPTPERNTPSRPGTAEGFRTQSQDRVSVQGFGPGGLNDRWRNKGKGRVTIVMASLYLQAGRWTDGLKELIEGATVAKSITTTYGMVKPRAHCH